MYNRLSVEHANDRWVAGHRVKLAHRVDRLAQRRLVGHMRDQAQLLDLAVIARFGRRGLEVLVHAVDRDAAVCELLRHLQQHARLVVNEEAHGEARLG